MDISAIQLNTTKKTENQNVQSASGRNFADCLETSTSLDAIFEKAAEKYGVPVALLKAIGKTESGFDANATSHCGAQGIMQLMPATANYLGVTDAYDPEQNIMGGAKYISRLLDKYDSNVPLALAAYNAGSGNVAKYGGIPPFEETQNYVKKVAAYMKGEIQIPDDRNTVTTKNGSAADIGGSALNKKVDMSFLEELNLDELFSYEDYGKLLKAYFYSLSLTPFMDEEQAEEVRKELRENVEAEQGQGRSDAYDAYQILNCTALKL